MNELREVLRGLAADLRFDPSTGWWLRSGPGERCVGADDRALGAIEEEILSRYFHRWPPGGPRARYGLRTSGEPAFVGALAAATRTAASWESGWSVVKSSESWAFVSDGKVCLFLEERRRMDPWQAREGASVRVKLPSARDNLWPGWFTLLGRAGGLPRGGPRVSLLLNLTADGAIRFAERLAADGKRPLNMEARFLNDPALYGRVDTGRVDVAPEELPALTAMVETFRSAHPACLRDGRPLFTQPLAPGVALAQLLPGEERPEAFAARRARLLAEAVLGTPAAKRPAEAWLRSAQRRLAAAGIPLYK